MQVLNMEWAGKMAWLWKKRMERPLVWNTQPSEFPLDFLGPLSITNWLGDNRSCRTKSRPPHPPWKALLSKDLSPHSTDRACAFHGSKDLPFNISPFCPSTRKHSSLWSFVNSHCPTPGANWKNPTGRSRTGRPTVLSTEPLFRPEFWSQPLAHKSGASLSSTRAALKIGGSCPPLRPCVGALKEQSMQTWAFAREGGWRDSP